MFEINDLRSAMELLSHTGFPPEQVQYPVNPAIELIEDYLNAYRRPQGAFIADEQPVRCYEMPTAGQFPVLMGVFGSRKRCRLFLDPSHQHPATVTDAELLFRAINHPIPPQKQVAALSDRVIVESPDLRRILPTLTYTAGDPGPTITLGMVYARDDARGIANCSVHRMTLKENRVTISISRKSHLQRLLDLHVAEGKRLPVSINIGLDPAIYIASALGKPNVDFGFDELSVVGALRNQPVNIAPCFSHQGWFVDHAEITLEGSLGADREFESPDKEQGYSMPEYLGYFSSCGLVSSLQINLLTYRPNAVYQSVSGPGYEQSALLGMAQEQALYSLLHSLDVKRSVREIVSLPSGGGHLMTVLQILKRELADDQGILALGMALLQRLSSLKNIILVDEDVNPHSADDILWAIATRSRLDSDIYATELLSGTALDPTQSAFYAGEGVNGCTRKCVIDCTAPFEHRQRFRRAFAWDAKDVGDRDG
ncbi:UbiD family decarboxylase [Serratia sp. DD3]|uniref:UbiD family decarboxylase n=1 Tax=Serratia sp. DD3 TaxID=1410619 RepID=UPI0003C50E59|nr:UbiD family decarboxylase [Serratia sp. DD3]KEY57328.1 3-octaprenyl-4-hydroxybenzoate carboxy-lyase [Serratia sp. DD3]